MIGTKTPGGLTPGVPVRLLTFDMALNAYTFTTADTPPLTLSFPITVKDDSSTETIGQSQNYLVYDGVELLPVEVSATSFPASDRWRFQDAIYVYPAGVGLPPLYAVFSSVYEGANTRGLYSGRMYNPDKAGGAIQDLDWVSAVVTQEGIALVKLHTSRFSPSDANNIMVARLEQILRGEIVASDVDKRFYTHEIRELERYRALGVSDSLNPEDRGMTWNNTHTATLEDFKLTDLVELFYTAEAIEADEAQIWREM